MLKIKEFRKPRELTEFNIWMGHCIRETMEKNRDINATVPKAMGACSFVHRNRNVPVEPRDHDQRIRMFLTGEIDLNDIRWIPPRKEIKETIKRIEKEEPGWTARMKRSLKE